jgi:hypothetical protein
MILIAVKSHSFLNVFFWVPGVKRWRREADYSPPSSAEVENAWSYTSTPPHVFMACFLIKRRICFHSVVLGKNSDNFILPKLFFILCGLLAFDFLSQCLYFLS